MPKPMRLSVIVAGVVALTLSVHAISIAQSPTPSAAAHTATEASSPRAAPSER